MGAPPGLPAASSGINVQDRSGRGSEPRGGRSGIQVGCGLRAEGERLSGEGVGVGRGEVDLGQSGDRLLQGNETPRADSNRSGGGNSELRQVMTLMREMQSELT